jgi:hypothetical protein
VLPLPLAPAFFARYLEENGKPAGRYLLDIARPTASSPAPGMYDEDAGRFIPAAIATGFLTADLLSPKNAGGWISGAELFGRFGLSADPP